MTWPLIHGADVRELEGAACYEPDPDKATLSPDAWFPSGKTAWEMGAARQAIAACRSCPVRFECVTQALAREEDDGIWGGFFFANPGEKKRARKALPRIKRRAA